MQSAESQASAVNILGFHPELKAEPLPLTVAGLQTLYGEIVAELAAAEHGLTDADVSTAKLLTYAETRMPAVFSRQSNTRGPAIAAIQRAEELVEETPAPEGGITWPVNPEWVSQMANQVVTPLVSTFATTCNVHLPGGTEFLRRAEAKHLPKVYATVDDAGEHHARTGFLPVPDANRDAQYAIHRRQGQIFMARRFRGDRNWERLSTIPAEAATPMLALLTWYQQTFESPI